MASETLPADHAAANAAAAKPASGARFAMLDGWRAMSILSVMAGHLLPLGPQRWGLNGASTGAGMALFFILSGFLITRFLSERAELRVFIIRRFFRIVPLAWVVMIALLIWDDADASTWAANLLFIANLPPQHLVMGGGHLWSLCVEMHFYVGIALFVAIFGRRGLIAMPLFALAVTAARIIFDHPADVVSWYRSDEIFAGGCLALIYSGWYGTAPQRVLTALAPLWWLLLILLIASSDYLTGPMVIVKPYLAAMVIGSTLFAPPKLLVRLFEHRWVAYVATISYALYIFHGALQVTWLGGGTTKIEHYMRRPLLIGVTFLLAHLSTFKFEQPMIALAKRLTRGLSVKAPA